MWSSDSKWCFFFSLNSIADLNPAHVVDINFNIFQLSQLNFKNILYIVSPIMAQGLYVLPGFGQRPFLVRRPNWENEEDWTSIWGFLPSTHIADDWLGRQVDLILWQSRTGLKGIVCLFLRILCNLFLKKGPNFICRIFQRENIFTRLSSFPFFVTSSRGAGPQLCGWNWYWTEKWALHVFYDLPLTVSSFSYKWIIDWYRSWNWISTKNVQD